MNNKLIVEKERLIERRDLLIDVIPKLKTILKNSSVFTKEESIIALERIKKYLELLNEEEKNNRVSMKKLHKEIYNSCTHDVIIKENNEKNIYECCICHEYFVLDDINFNCFLIDDVDGKQMSWFSLISHIIKEIAINDDDIFEVFEDKLYSKNNNLLVYRRYK